MTPRTQAQGGGGKKQWLRNLCGDGDIESNPGPPTSAGNEVQDIEQCIGDLLLEEVGGDTEMPPHAPPLLATRTALNTYLEQHPNRLSTSEHQRSYHLTNGEGFHIDTNRWVPCLPVLEQLNKLAPFTQDIDSDAVHTPFCVPGFGQGQYVDLGKGAYTHFTVHNENLDRTIRRKVDDQLRLEYPADDAALKQTPPDHRDFGRRILAGQKLGGDSVAQACNDLEKHRRTQAPAIPPNIGDWADSLRIAEPDSERDPPRKHQRLVSSSPTHSAERAQKGKHREPPE